jgi:predicted GIY-YIG superfamily endonuclease
MVFNTPKNGKNPYYVYVIESEQPRYSRKGKRLPGLHYVGMTVCPFRRLREHNGLYANGKAGNPKGGRYTSKHRYWQMRAIWGPYATRSEALKAEYALKRGKRGVARTKWAAEDSKWCRGLGAQDPRVSEINEKLQVLRNL